MYGFIVEFPENRVNYLSVEETAILLMRKDGRFDRVLPLYQEGLVKIDWERDLRRMKYIVRFTSEKEMCVLEKTPKSCNNNIFIFYCTNFIFDYSELVSYKLTEIIE